MITIQLNGEAYQLQDTATVASLIESLTLDQDKIAVECNRDIVPRSQFDVQALAEGDRVEIITFVGGG